MNKHQMEVEQSDLKHRVRVRTVTLLATATILASGLWAAGMFSTEWSQRLTVWWSLRADEQTQAGQNPSRVEVVIPSTAPTTDTNQPAPGTLSSISEEPLRLHLVSTSPGRNKFEGSARLGTAPDHPQTFSAGAILANGAQLKEIHTDRVVLERGEERVILYMGDKRAKGDQQLASVGGAQPAAIVHEKHKDNLTDVIRSMPFYENDALVGIKVIPGQKVSVFGQLGLVSEDIVIAIDGAPIADASNAAELLRSLADGAALTVTVRRRGDIKTLSLDGQIIVAALDSSTTPAPVPPG